MRARLYVLGCFLSALAAAACSYGAEPTASNLPLESASLPTMRRRPAALAVVDQFVWVAHRASGSISVVEPAAGRIVSETRIGTSLTSLAAVPSQRLVFAIDAAAHELLVLDAAEARRPTVAGRAPLAFDPIEVLVADDGTWATATSRWSRRVTFLRWTRSNSHADVGQSIRLELSPPIDLPFAPRRMAIAPDGRRLIVADAFGSSVAVVDRERRRIEKVWQIPGHHLDGLARSHDGRHLVIAHQILNGREITNDDPVFWGALLNNALQSFAWDDLLATLSRQPEGKVDQAASTLETLDRGLLLPLGEPSHGTGDPGAVWIGQKGRTIVCLAGVDELAVRADAQQPMVRRSVGRLPVAVAAHETLGWAVVANQLDDSLTILDLDALQPRGEALSLGPQPPRTAVDEGERLFYDARLSLDGWFSCHSCHVEGHSSHLVNDNFGDDSTGAPKRVPSLLGTASTGPWAWNGSQPDLSKQIAKSLVHTMRGGPSSPQPARVEALRAFVESLRPAPPLAVARAHRGGDALTDDAMRSEAVRDDASLVRAGRTVFERERCADCHSGQSLTHEKAFDVGLRDEHGATRFNPPSLAGASQRDAFLHDARVKRLADVFLQVGHPHDAKWSVEDVRALVAYLETR
ncbi:MAG: cytochrome c peroxidase [Pirellulales bacterium]